jgi:hypothetical protein
MMVVTGEGDDGYGSDGGDDSNNDGDHDGCDVRESDDGYGTDGGDGCDDGCNGYGDNSGNFI